MDSYLQPTKTGYKKTNLNDRLKDLKVKLYFDSPFSSSIRDHLRKSKPDKTFTLDGRTYIYFRHYHNAIRNERAVEVPAVWAEVRNKAPKRILEVGNVLSYYFRFKHDIVDKYESSDGVINEDIVNFTPKAGYDMIVSISTLEHVGWDEEPREPRKILKAFEKLKSCLSPGGTLIVTMPIGHNTEMDGMIDSGEISFDKTLFLKRVSESNQWVQVDWDEAKKARYGHPFMYGNAVIIGSTRK
ncbi:MAG: hypothetical protein WCX65_18255 [bacterium]